MRPAIPVGTGMLHKFFFRWRTPFFTPTEQSPTWSAPPIGTWNAASRGWGMCITLKLSLLFGPTFYSGLAWFGPESRRRQTLVKPPIFRIIGTISGRICNLEKWGPFKLLDIYSGTPLIGRKPTYRVRFVEVLQVYAVQKLHVPPRKRTAKNTEKSVWKTILSFSNDSFWDDKMTCSSLGDVTYIPRHLKTPKRLEHVMTKKQTYREETLKPHQIRYGWSGDTPKNLNFPKFIPFPKHLPYVSIFHSR